MSQHIYEFICDTPFDRSNYIKLYSVCFSQNICLFQPKSVCFSQSLSVLAEYFCAIAEVHKGVPWIRNHSKDGGRVGWGGVLEGVDGSQGGCGARWGWDARAGSSVRSGDSWDVLR